MSSLVVPLVLWGPKAPSHCISVMYFLRDQKTLCTGARDGQIIIWEVTKEWVMTPRHMLIGHTSQVLCICKATRGCDSHHIVSSADNGEMFTWDTVDGRCIESNKLPGLIHSNIQAYRSPDSNSVRLFCCGCYEEIVVIDPFSLGILFRLSSRTIPDWISAFHVLRPRNRRDDVVLAITISGTVKVWTLNGDEHHLSEPILENESKQIKCIDAISLSCCVYNMRTVLIVCPNHWAVYDAGDFTLLLSISSSPGNGQLLGAEFVSSDRICVWSDKGNAVLYRLPSNCLLESSNFHQPSTNNDDRSLELAEIATQTLSLNLPESCPPVFKYIIYSRDGIWQRYLMRGDCYGQIGIWRIPEASELSDVKTSIPISRHVGLAEAWKNIEPSPVGFIDELRRTSQAYDKLAHVTIFLPAQCRIVFGREDGSIILLPATQIVMMHLLTKRKRSSSSSGGHLLLSGGHSGRVNCLLYPHNDHPRYEASHLVSGSIDFSVCLWDIYIGSLLHRFVAHSGEIERLYVLPSNMKPRFNLCICSVASDRSVAILSLSEQRCIMLASRHLFDVVVIKWRPLDDFLVVQCCDGTVYIWEMETGSLDRVVHGRIAEDIMEACDDVQSTTLTIGDNVGANPALHFFRGLRHRNLAALKLAAQSGIHSLQGKTGEIVAVQDKNRAFPLTVNGLRNNPQDSEGHLILFDVEALIVQMLSEEYSAMSPGTMEAQGLTVQREYDRVWAITKASSVDTAQKIAGFLNKVKDKADDRIQSLSQTPENQRKLTNFIVKVKEGAEKAKGEFERRAGALDSESSSRKASSNELDLSLRPTSLRLEINLTLEIGQLLLSLLHAWGLDPDLDKVAVNKLGLLEPLVPVSFGILSRGGAVSLMLPTWLPNQSVSSPRLNTEKKTKYFTALGHWELSHVITTDHLLSIIAITNTLVSISNASFIPEQERKRKLVRQATHGIMEMPKEPDFAFSHQQAQIKQGWSLLSTLHCLLLSSKLKELGSTAYRMPLVELLANRWQDRCLQVRLAAQELLVAELKNLGTKGRKYLVEIWGVHLPNCVDIAFKSGPSQLSTNGFNTDTDTQTSGETLISQTTSEDADSDEIDDDVLNSVAAEVRRNQTTSVILLGVIGALFDLEAENQDKEGILGHQLTRHTAKALMFLVLGLSSPRLPSSSSLRRAAIDLIARGFILWEPHLEVSKILLSLLEMCCEADWWVPSTSYGLPLTASGDSCRTSRHALSQIAQARPDVFITSIAREVSRYHNLASNAQVLNVNPVRHVLFRSKAEILHLIEILIKDNKNAIIDALLVDVIDIVLHCIDNQHLKSQSLSELFPPVAAFPQVSHCLSSRRVALGTQTGQLSVYDLRTGKMQLIKAHIGPVIAASFSPDGKHLATFCIQEGKLSFWQTSTGLFGLGNTQTKCTKSYNTQPLSQAVQCNPMCSPKLVWFSAKTITLLLPDGTESKFNC